MTLRLPGVPLRLALLAVLTVFAVASCKGPQLPPAIAAAQALERGGEHDEQALAAWRTLGSACPSRAAAASVTGSARPPLSRPEKDCGLAAVRQAELLERLGRWPEALAAWRSVSERTRGASDRARALARAAELLEQRLAQPEPALALAWRCVEELPDEVGADDALALLVRRERGRDPAALRARLDELATRLAADDIADNLFAAAADLSRHELADPAGALARLDALITRYPRSGLRDDAIYQAALLLRDRGVPRAALERLRLLTTHRRRALITGSYNAILLDDAQLLVGRIQLDDLHDPEAAARAFLTLADDYKDSPLRDDALLELARARLAAHEPPTDEDRRAACAALTRLMLQFPDGNRVRDAEREQDRLRCGDKQ